MAGLVKLSEAVSLGLHAAVILAGNHDGPCTAHRLAEWLSASEAHLAKVMQRLVKAGLVTSTRGPKGGFVLAASAGELSLLEVYEAIEGPVEPAACVFGLPVCGGGACIFGGVLAEIEGRFRDYLAQTTVSELSLAIDPRQETIDARR